MNKLKFRITGVDEGIVFGDRSISNCFSQLVIAMCELRNCDENYLIPKNNFKQIYLNFYRRLNMKNRIEYI